MDQSRVLVTWSFKTTDENVAIKNSEIQCNQGDYILPMGEVTEK